MNHLKIDLEKSLHGFTSQIGVIGMGYVGLPLALRFAEVGYNTVGFDTDKMKIKKLSSGESYIQHIPTDRIKSLVNNNFLVTDDWSIIQKIDAIIICVPTPLTAENEPDLQFIRATLQSIQPFLKEGQLLILESTTYPGTTEEELVVFARQCGFVVGKNYFIGYSPEREDPGNQIYNTKNIPKIVSGYTSNCLHLTKVLYDSILDSTVSVSSTRAAEMTKILENVHRAVNIGLVNELKIIADKMDIDIHEVIEAASTKPFGFTPYYPGPGLGGHCIPIDPFYLSWKAKKYGVTARFIKLAGIINTSMPKWVIEKLKNSLTLRNKSLNGATVLILGLAYKKNVDDVRESPSLELMSLLINNGAIVDYSDPFIKETPITRKHKFSLKSVNLTAPKIASYDAILLATDHDIFDYEKIEKYSQLIVDTRGRFKSGKNIVKA